MSLANNPTTTEAAFFDRLFDAAQSKDMQEIERLVKSDGPETLTPDAWSAHVYRKEEEERQAFELAERAAQERQREEAKRRKLREEQEQRRHSRLRTLIMVLISLILLVILGFVVWEFVIKSLLGPQVESQAFLYPMMLAQFSQAAVTMEEIPAELSLEREIP